MISIDTDKTMTDVARLREIGRDIGEIGGSLDQSRAEYQQAWQGGAGEAFQDFAASLHGKFTSFIADADALADDITRICAVFSEADKGIKGF